jgi:hypothetical protein
MRQTHIRHRIPISDLFLDQLHPVTVDDLRNNVAWRFAPVGVLSHVERDTMNLHQLQNVAKAFNLPIIRWRCDLVDGSTLGQNVRNELYEHEPNIWSYFVEGAPVLLSETISSVRMLVNGSPGLLNSLNIINDNDLMKIEQAYNIGYDDSMVTLEATPLTVNVAVGATTANPIMWHQVVLKEPNP